MDSSSKIIAHEPIYEALNTENYRGSLKEAYLDKSMAPSLFIDRNDSDSDSFTEEEIIFMTQQAKTKKGYSI